MVYMAGGFLSDTRDDASAPKGGRRLGFPEYRFQIQGATVQSVPDVGGKRTNSPFGADA